MCQAIIIKTIISSSIQLITALLGLSSSI
uniref:Histone H4 n=1 Tax=Rhizophora mucronata TaxID=61149 RepID=A0A2P2QP88_RHIMU